VAKASPYRAYSPQPFLKADRSSVEILFGGLHWRAEHVIAALFENLGYRARPLPPASKADLLAGRELADIGQCCPTSFTTGNLANFLQAEKARLGMDAVAERYVHVTAGACCACRACRFGQYHQSYELALRNLGLEHVRMFLLSQSDLDQGEVAGGGLELNMSLTIGLLWAILCTDVLQSLEYQTRPYEVRAGQTDAVVRESVEYLCDTFRRRPAQGRKWSVLVWHLVTDYFTAALREVFRRFDAIEVDRLQPKPVVKITGEFYLQTVEGDPNYNIHRWLESEGAEVYPAAVAV
jgi:predicted nucleotide-binding protein (sugar kinase/HSP70/actin superfamily)